MEQQPDPWFCYMLECSDGSLYVGATKDLASRVKRHNRGLGARHTAKHRPVKLIWFDEHPTEGAARRRETELKGWRREKKLELIEREPSAIHPSPTDRAQDEFSS